jgi:hypothetical protein
MQQTRVSGLYWLRNRHFALWLRKPSETGHTHIQGQTYGRARQTHALPRTIRPRRSQWRYLRPRIRAGSCGSTAQLLCPAHRKRHCNAWFAARTRDWRPTLSVPFVHSPGPRGLTVSDSALATAQWRKPAQTRPPEPRKVRSAAQSTRTTSIRHEPSTWACPRPSH